MDVDSALAEVRRRMNGRTYHEGQPRPVDEVLAEEVERLRAALALARLWGIQSVGYSALQAGDLAEWFDNGCKGPPPRAPHLPRRALENDRG